MDAGPHIGRIVSNVDPHRQGAVQVELLGSVGDQRGMDQQVFTVRYASPSFGSTDVEHDATNTQDYHGTQQSHGFWSPPPNTGSLVMCVFIGGDPGQGYYFSCIQDQHMNQSVPGIASTKQVKKQYKSYDPDSGDWSKTTDTESLTDKGSQLPVSEINRPSAKGMQPDTSKMEKPVNSARVSQLAAQGLLDDPYRGTHTSSARRESPSNVHGWSTPGPLDKTPGAPTRAVGPRDTQATKHTARRPGHSFIMDDGDETHLRKSKPGSGPAEYANLQAGETGGDVMLPKDQQIRITAANGAQFIMHSSEDFIHIHNSKGTAWVEMTSNGKIDIYTADCVSVHTEADYNITSDRDINLHAGRTVNIYADHDVNLHSKTETHIKADTNIHMSASTHIAVNAEGGSLTLMSDDVANIVSKDVRVDTNNLEVLSKGHIHMTSDEDTNITAVQMFLKSMADMHVTASGAILHTSAQSHLVTYSKAIIHSYGTIDMRSDDMFSASGSDMAFTSDGPVSVTASGGNMDLFSSAQTNLINSDYALTSSGAISLTSSGGDIKLQGSPNVQLNSGAGRTTTDPGRKKGPVEAATDAFNLRLAAENPEATSPITAVQAGEAHEATGHKPHPTKVTASTVKQVPHTGYGRAATTRVPGPQPYDGHEHLNPPGHTQDLTDKHNSDQPYNKDEEKKQISHPDDMENLPNGNRKQGANVHGNRRNPYPHHPSPGSDPSTNVTSHESQISNRGTPTDWVQDQEFMGDVASLSGKLGITVSELLAIFAAETGSGTLDPSKTNGDGCVGLVQICKSTNPQTGKTSYDELAARSPKEAADDNLSPEGLRKLTRHRQMFWIDKYFDLILPSGPGIFPTEDRVCYIWMALSAGTDSSKLITKNTIYPFSDSRCKRNSGWQDPTQNNDCTVKKACTWLRWYEKQYITPKLGSKSFSPDLSSGPGSTIQPGPSAGAPSPGSVDSNFPGKVQESTMPAGAPGVPNSARWSWYNDKYIAVDITGQPVDSSGAQVSPDAAFSKPQDLSPPSPPSIPSTGGLPANLMSGLNPNGTEILGKDLLSTASGLAKTATSTVKKTISSKLPKLLG